MDRLKAYSVLGLAQGADEADVKAAYKALAQKYNVDNYEAGPLREEAEARMTEINEAFDLLMSYLRTGGVEATRPQSSSSSSTGNYPAIRQLINSGQVDEALNRLNQIPGGASDAEWNFLMGSAYYYKGWLDQALHYFQKAVQLAPGNREYEAALRNLQNSAGGNMQGSPFGGQQDQNAQAMNCACNTCTMMCCMDACCSMCRGC